MDYQEFEEIYLGKEDNVIHLMSTEQDDCQDDKGALDKKWKDKHYFSSLTENSSSESSYDSDGQNDDQSNFKSKHKNTRKIEYDDEYIGSNHNYINYQNNQKEAGDNKRYPLRQCNPQQFHLRENKNNQLSAYDESTPFSRNDQMSSLKDDNLERPLMKQIYRDMKNSKEVLKLCLLDSRQQTTEELLHEINDVNRQNNPNFRKNVLGTHHERKNRVLTTLNFHHHINLISQILNNSSQPHNNLSISSTPGQYQTNNIPSQNVLSKFNNQLKQPISIHESRSPMHTSNNKESDDKSNSDLKRESEQQTNQLFTPTATNQIPKSSGNIQVADNFQENNNPEIIPTNNQERRFFQRGGHQVRTEVILREPKSELFFTQDDLSSNNIQTKTDGNTEVSSQQQDNSPKTQILIKNETNEDVFSQNQFVSHLNGGFQSKNRKRNVTTISPILKIMGTVEENTEQSEGKISSMINPLKEEHDDVLQEQDNSLDFIETKPRALTSALIYEQTNNSELLGPKKHYKNCLSTDGYVNHEICSKTENSNSSSNVQTDEELDQDNNFKPSSKSASRPRKSQSCENFFDQAEKDDHSPQINMKQENANDHHFKLIAQNLKKIKMLRSNTVCYDQDKKEQLLQQLEQLNMNHNHAVIDENKQEGCVACDLHQLIKQGNNQKEKQPEPAEPFDPYKVFKEVPMHVIESRFYLKQTSSLNQETNNEKDKEDGKKVFIMGNRGNPDMKPLKVYFFNREDVSLDFELNLKDTSIGTFIKYVITSYKSKGSMNQQLLRFPDNPGRYKIFPNMGESPSERYIADVNIPELSDFMMLQDTIGDCAECCFVEADENQIESNSISRIIEDPEQDLHEFQTVYSKSGQMVFSVQCREKEFSTIIRIDKDKLIDDLFENIQKKKKIDIDKKNFFFQGKAFGSDELVELDLRMPLSVINDKILRICRREYEDRQGGTIENKIVSSNNGKFFSFHDNSQDDSLDEAEEGFALSDLDDDDLSSSEHLNYQGRRKKEKGNKINKLPLFGLDLSQMRKYEAFEVTKITQVSNEIYKKSPRIIGIDENFIHNHKVQPNLLSFRNLLCFFFPASPSDTKCPKKKIDDIKDMYIIEGTNLLLQFYQKDNLKYWLLYNPDPSVSRRMFEKLTYLRKSLEVRLP